MEIGEKWKWGEIEMCGELELISLFGIRKEMKQRNGGSSRRTAVAVLADLPDVDDDD